MKYFNTHPWKMCIHFSDFGYLGPEEEERRGGEGGSGW